MGIQAMLQEPQLDEDQMELRRQFLEETGYGPSDILSLNYSTRTFLMRTGGLYRMMDDGSIDHLGGPSPDPEERF